MNSTGVSANISRGPDGGARIGIMGVLNVTPDSFSDGGLYQAHDVAVQRALQLVQDGADIVDVGGESTRPSGARAVGEDAEIERVLPVIRELRRLGVPVSVDTTKASVAAAAIEVGCTIVNDISGGLFDPCIVDVVRDAGATYVLGHLRGRTLRDVHRASTSLMFADVLGDLTERLAAIGDDLAVRTIVDPGLGFGKGTAQNLELIRRCGELAMALGRPIMLGPSRKRFLGELTGAAVSERDSATVGACLAGVCAGASWLRVHDVKALAQALLVYRAVIEGEDARGQEGRE